MLGRTPPIGVESASAFAEPNMKTDESQGTAHDFERSLLSRPTLFLLSGGHVSQV